MLIMSRRGAGHPSGALLWLLLMRPEQGPARTGEDETVEWRNHACLHIIPVYEQRYAVGMTDFVIYCMHIMQSAECMTSLE